MSCESQSPCTSGAANAAPGAPNEHVDMLRFWEQHSAKATISSMFLDDEPFAYADEDTAEVLATLPDVAGGTVVELGAGIGCASPILSRLISSSLLSALLCTRFSLPPNRHIGSATRVKPVRIAHLSTLHTLDLHRGPRVYNLQRFHCNK